LKTDRHRLPGGGSCPGSHAAVVAIDGPAASGKSTVARRVAAQLGRLYVDSGALYRAITWRALQDGVDVGDSAAVVELAESLRIEFFVKQGAVWFKIAGVELDRELRTEAIAYSVSPVAAVPAVRSVVVSWLKQTASLGDLVMEGRDIGTVVFPHTPWKFYLDASPEERARRRYAETERRETDCSAVRIGESIKRRDRIDSGRKADPLRTASDAVVIDSTGMSIDEVVSLIVERIRPKR